MDPIGIIYSNDEYFQESLIQGLPNEISLQCIPYFSCKTLYALSRVSKIWNIAVQQELFSYKCVLRKINFDVFQSMTGIWNYENQEKINLENRIVEETYYDPARFGGISNELYSELLETMKKIAKVHKNTLFLFEPPPNLNRFEQYACSHLLPLKNVISLTDATIDKRLNIKSIGKKIDTLILIGTVCRSPIALMSLEVTIPQMKKIKTLIWSSVDLRKDNEDNFAFEAFSKIIGKITNLTFLSISKFKVNDMGSKNLLILINNFKKLISLNLKASEIDGSLNLINDKIVDRLIKKFSPISVSFILKEDPEKQEYYRKITWKFGMQ